MFRDLIAQAEPAVVMVICPDIGSKGSGFIVSPDGHVVTNNHVVSQATFQNGVLSITYSTRIIAVIGGTPFPTQLIHDTTADQPVVYDYAILKVDGLVNTPFLELADPTSPRRGDSVICLGFPLDFESLIATSGIVSAIIRRQSHFNALHQMQTLVSDALIRFGNSGGPMLDAGTGKVIGINTLHHELQDDSRVRLAEWLLGLGADDFALIRDLIAYSLRYTYVGLNHAVSIEYVRNDPAWP
jgi:S1-C subfamily serine protease